MVRRSVVLAAALAVLASTCGSGGPTSSAPGTATPGSTLVFPSPSATPSSAPTREEGWASDIAHLMERMESLHPDLYHGISRADLSAAAGALAAQIPTSTEDQMLVGVMHLVALVSSKGRDGHMGVWPPDNPETVHRYPMRLWEFPDGLYVTAARAPNDDLAGGRLITVEGRPIDEVLAALDPLVPRDNDSNLRAARTVFLTSAEVLVGLGIASDASHIEVEVEDVGGLTRAATIGAVDAQTFADWLGGWELALPPRGDTLQLRDPTADHWTEYLPTDRVLYVQYNEVRPGSADLAEEVRAALAEHGVDRVILDLRNNPGGEAEGYIHLLDLLAAGASPHLVVLIGRLTFSAAASLVAEIEQRVPGATLVGEPTGGAPNFWADVIGITLPNSGLNALVSTTYEGYGRPGDPRLAIAPDVAVALTAADYFAGRDPALDAALAG